MKNEQILNTPDSLLHGLDRQRKFLLRVALTPQPCPVCGAACNLIEALGVTLDDYTFDGGDRSYRCASASCGVALEQVVPLMVTGPGHWHWARRRS